MEDSMSELGSTPRTLSTVSPRTPRTLTTAGKRSLTSRDVERRDVLDGEADDLWDDRHSDVSRHSSVSADDGEDLLNSRVAESMLSRTLPSTAYDSYDRLNDTVEPTPSSPSSTPRTHSSFGEHSLSPRSSTRDSSEGGEGEMEFNETVRDMDQYSDGTASTTTDLHEELGSQSYPSHSALRTAFDSQHSLRGATASSLGDSKASTPLSSRRPLSRLTEQTHRTMSPDERDSLDGTPQHEYDSRLSSSRVGVTPPTTGSTQPPPSRPPPPTTTSSLSSSHMASAPHNNNKGRGLSLSTTSATSLTPVGNAHSITVYDSTCDTSDGNTLEHHLTSTSMNDVRLSTSGSSVTADHDEHNPPIAPRPIMEQPTSQLAASMAVGAPLVPPGGGGGGGGGSMHPHTISLSVHEDTIAQLQARHREEVEALRRAHEEQLSTETVQVKNELRDQIASSSKKAADLDFKEKEITQSRTNIQALSEITQQREQFVSQREQQLKELEKQATEQLSIIHEKQAEVEHAQKEANTVAIQLQHTKAHLDTEMDSVNDRRRHVEKEAEEVLRMREDVKSYEQELEAEQGRLKALQDEITDQTDLTAKKKAELEVREQIIREQEKLAAERSEKLTDEERSVQLKIEEVTAQIANLWQQKELLSTQEGQLRATMVDIERRETEITRVAKHQQDVESEVHRKRHALNDDQRRMDNWEAQLAKKEEQMEAVLRKHAEETEQKLKEREQAVTEAEGKLGPREEKIIRNEQQLHDREVTLLNREVAVEKAEADLGKQWRDLSIILDRERMLERRRMCGNEKKGKYKSIAALSVGSIYAQKQEQQLVDPFGLQRDPRAHRDQKLPAMIAELSHMVSSASKQLNADIYTTKQETDDGELPTHAQDAVSRAALWEKELSTLVGVMEHIQNTFPLQTSKHASVPNAVPKVENWWVDTSNKIDQCLLALYAQRKANFDRANAMVNLPQAPDPEPVVTLKKKPTARASVFSLPGHVLSSPTFNNFMQKQSKGTDEVEKKPQLPDVPCGTTTDTIMYKLVGLGSSPKSTTKGRSPVHFTPTFYTGPPLMEDGVNGPGLSSAPELEKIAQYHNTDIRQYMRTALANSTSTKFKGAALHGAMLSDPNATFPLPKKAGAMKFPQPIVAGKKKGRKLPDAAPLPH